MQQRPVFASDAAAEPVWVGHDGAAVPEPSGRSDLAHRFKRFPDLQRRIRQVAKRNRVGTADAQCDNNPTAVLHGRRSKYI